MWEETKDIGIRKVSEGVKGKELKRRLRLAIKLRNE